MIVPPSWPGDRNDYALEAAKRYPNRFAVMGRIPLKNPQAAALLPKWKEQPGMLGVRADVPRSGPGLADRRHAGLVLARRPRRPDCPSCFLRRDRYRMFARIAERHPQLHAHHRPHGPELVEPYQQGSPRSATAIDQAVALAKYPNVSRQVVGVRPATRSKPYPFRDMTPHLQAAVRRLRS